MLHPGRLGNADVTDETGVDGTIRFLRNVMGLWVLSELCRYEPSGSDRDWDAAERRAEEAVPR